ncbi:Hint domain-containing protein [Amylibacter sp. SFDW26]|uniref:Hint domain-containing protein n=1 Tax=Amylibacter sp. SFDW26 TaxID=2652722 RepID=UPI001869AF83|nr:Hint domain-containing protein [Amylibacter sp. SFDW26]
MDTPTTTTTTSDTFNGLNVTQQVTLPVSTDETLPLSVDITTSGLSPDINIALVIDTSGSTGNNSGSDVDGDGDNDTFLEAQQIAAQEVFQSFIDAGYDPSTVEITLIEYNNDGATLGTFTLDQQSQFNTAVNGLNDGGATNFESGLDEVIDTWTAAGDVDTNDTNAVIFLSDGARNRGDNGSDELTLLETNFGASVTAIGVGSNSSLGGLNTIDNTGGAERVTDVAQLVDVITAPPPLPELQEVEVFVDGVSYGVFTPGDGVLVTTPLGFTINNEEIAGFPVNFGEDLEVEVVSRFDEGSSVLTSGVVIIPFVPCFVKGSKILTARGLTNVEELEVGDHILTRDNGLQEIRWIGSSNIPSSRLAENIKLRPIKIAKDAFGTNMPEQDLFISRQHRVFLQSWHAELMFNSSDILIPAHVLVNDTTITVDHSGNSVTYYHIAFDQHEIIFSNGLPTESFHPCAATVADMKPEAREELLELFPQMVEEKAAYPAAYPSLKSYEARIITKNMDS